MGKQRKESHVDTVEWMDMAVLGIEFSTTEVAWLHSVDESLLHIWKA